MPHCNKRCRPQVRIRTGARRCALVGHWSSTLEKASFFIIFVTTCIIFNIMEFICHVILFVEVRKQYKMHVQLCLQNKPKLAKLTRGIHTSYSDLTVDMCLNATGLWLASHRKVRAIRKVSFYSESYTIKRGERGSEWMDPTIDFLLVKKHQIPLFRMRSLSAAAARPPARRGGLAAAAAALGAVLNVFRFIIAYSQIYPIGHPSWARVQKHQVYWTVYQVIMKE